MIESLLNLGARCSTLHLNNFIFFKEVHFLNMWKCLQKYCIYFTDYDIYFITSVLTKLFSMKKPKGDQ